MKILRIFSFLISGIVLLILYEQPTVADAGVGWVLPAAGITGLFLIIPPMLIEMFFIRRIVGIKTRYAFNAALLMNVYSTAAGFLLALSFLISRNSPFAAFVILVFAALIPALLHVLFTGSSKLIALTLITTTVGALGLSLNEYYNQMDMKPGGDDLWRLIYLLSVIIYGYGLSLAIEVWPAKKYIPIAQLDSTVIKVNIYSYMVFFAIWFAMLISQLPFLLYD